MQSSAHSSTIRSHIENIETLVIAGNAVETTIMQDEVYPDLCEALTGKLNKKLHISKYLD